MEKYRQDLLEKELEYMRMQSDPQPKNPTNGMRFLIRWGLAFLLFCLSVFENPIMDEKKLCAWIQRDVYVDQIVEIAKKLME